MANQQSKNIQYSGLTTLPDDYQSVDGSLAFATNAIYEDNAVKIIPPALAKNLIVQKGDKVYVHSMATYTHYIVVHQEDDGVRMWFVSEEEIPAYQEWAREEGDGAFYERHGDKIRVVYSAQEFTNKYADSSTYKYSRIAYLIEQITWYDQNGASVEVLEGTFKDVAFVGNTMIVSTSAHRYYLIWDTSDNYYKYLGYKIPKVDIQWGLSLTLAKSVYLDCGITLKKEKKPATDDFTSLCSIYYYHDQTMSAFYYPEQDGVKLKPNTVYRAYQYIMSDKKSHPTIQCKRYNETIGDYSWQDLCQVPKESKKYSYFKTGDLGEDDGDVRLQVSRRKASGRVYIEEGVMENNELKFTSVEANIIENTSNNHTAVLGYINKFVNEQGKKNNRFIHPFFLRYAIKLYDGSWCNLSTPILLYPNTGYAPFLKVTKQDGYTDAEAYAFAADLRMQLMSYLGSEWEDLILGVGIFVSEPIYPYDQGKGYDENVDDYTYLFANKDIDQIKGVNYGIGIYCGDVTTGGYVDNNNTETGGDSLTDVGEEGSEDGYIPNDIVYPMVNQCGYGNINDNNGVDCVTTTQIAKKQDGEIRDDILNTCNFYKIREIEFSDISGQTGYDAVANNSRFDLNLEDGTLNSLEARETLKEEEIEFADFSDVSLFVYNNRLHITGGSRTLPEVTSTVRQNGLCENADPDVTDPWGGATAIVRIRTDEGIRNIYCRSSVKYLAPWFFYPDTRAFEYLELAPDSARVTETDDGENETNYTWISYELKTHDFLNGSYLLRDVGKFCSFCYLDDEGNLDTDVMDLADTTNDTVQDYTENTKVDNLNRIYVSEASNPFVFKNSMVCTAGSGQVLALSSAAKALSQGQFGQFPLYAFTDEGIWAMSVGSTGAYETVQPIARDVVPTDAVKAITQLDSSVVFVTNRGVMLVEGSNVVCMSDDIDGDFGQFDPTSLDGFYDIMKQYLDFSMDDTDKTIGKWASQAFFDFIRSCQMKYDYVHQRITMYSDDCDIAYVYSLKSKQWLMQLTALQDNVNSYPDAYALRNLSDTIYGVKCTELVNLSEYDLETARLPMVFITRPFKLDAPDTFKTVNDIIQRGYFRQDEKIKHIIGAVLYGSPDLFNWFAVKSNVGSKVQNLHGSPYKYFRVLVVSQLDAKEGISGCSVWYEPKDTQRLR